MSRKVVLTGAAGHIARLMLPGLRERYDLTLLDLCGTNSDGEKIEGIVTVDLLERDRDAYAQYFRGADAVIHSALVHSDQPEERYWRKAPALTWPITSITRRSQRGCAAWL